jgi:hypothetical protein
MLLDGKQIKNGSITNAKLATPAGSPSTNNKGMTASVTSADFQIACATALTATAASGSYIEVLVNGAQQELGDGVKTKDSYFSGDSGTTARAISAIVATDVLYWVGSVAGFQLAATDKISFIYNT